MQWVDTHRVLEDAAKTLASAKALYIDTEFESRRDGTELCLLQIGDGSSLFLIDALRLTSFAPLHPVLSGDREWVLHAGTQDIPLILERARIAEWPRVFDTQVAWALQSAEASVSLAYLKFKLLGMRSGKAHQADDWKRRPLPDSQLAYAAADIADLPEMHRLLRERLVAKNRGEIVYAASAEATRPVQSEIEGISLDSFRNAWQLDHRGQAALRHIVSWYNGLDVRERENAPEMKTLLAIAGRLPQTRDDLGRIKGVSRWFVNERGNRFLAELMKATANADDASFVPIDPPPYATFEEIRLDGWLSQLRAQICIELEIAPELAFPGRILKKMRNQVLESGDPERAVEALEGWRKQLIGPVFERAWKGLAQAGTTPSGTAIAKPGA